MVPRESKGRASACFVFVLSGKNSKAKQNTNTRTVRRGIERFLVINWPEQQSRETKEVPWVPGGEVNVLKDGAESFA